MGSPPSRTHPSADEQIVEYGLASGIILICAYATCMQTSVPLAAYSSRAQQWSDYTKFSHLPPRPSQTLVVRSIQLSDFQTALRPQNQRRSRSCFSNAPSICHLKLRDTPALIDNNAQILSLLLRHSHCNITPQRFGYKIGASCRYFTHSTPCWHRRMMLITNVQSILLNLQNRLYLSLIRRSNMRILLQPFPQRTIARSLVILMWKRLRSQLQPHPRAEFLTYSKEKDREASQY